MKFWKSKIEPVEGIDHYRVNLGQGKTVEFPMAEIAMWGMELPKAKQDEYRTIDYHAVHPPRGHEDARIDFDAHLDTRNMFALHNRIARVTSWWPVESGERPWKDIFSKFHTLVLYDGRTPVGIAHYTKPEDGDKTVELKYIGLREDMIGKGLGRYFATSCLAYMAKQHPAQQITLGTTSFDVFEGKRAIDFHKHMGFAVIGDEDKPVKKLIPDVREYYKIPEIAAKHLKLYAATFEHGPRISAAPRLGLEFV